MRASLRWTAGAGIPDVDASALLLEENGEVASDADFVFYNQPEHYSGAVRMAGKTAVRRPRTRSTSICSRIPPTTSGSSSPPRPTAGRSGRCRTCTWS